MTVAHRAAVAVAVALGVSLPACGDSGDPSGSIDASDSGDPADAAAGGDQCGAPRWPEPACTGVPDGWTPATTESDTVIIDQDGAVVEDLLVVDADILVEASDVTLRRVHVQGGRIINDSGPSCGNGLLLEDVSITPGPDAEYSENLEAVVGPGGYTARRVEIWNRAEGLRVGGLSAGCDPVVVEDSFILIAPEPEGCEAIDWHGDGIQGYDGNQVTVRNLTIDFIEPPGCGGTAPFFYPADQGNTYADVDRLLVRGGGYPFRLGTAGVVDQLRIVNESWGYGPIEVDCALVEAWEAELVTIDTDYQVTATVAAQPCDS